MANIKSAQKQARKSKKRYQINLARKTAIKTATKKALAALEQGETEKARELLQEVEAKLARAKSKGTIHAKTASRKISRLTKRAQTKKK